MGAGDLVGQVLHDTYRIDKRIGRGGNGEVYRASHLRLPRRFAVKVLLPAVCGEREAVARFEREARVTSAIGNPHIVEVVDFYSTPDGRPYLVMELLEGEDLAAHCRRRGRLEPFEVAAILRQVADGLRAAHRKGVIHRDLKPQNIFLCRSARADLLVKVLDFGTSKILGKPRELSHNLLLGTPHYMAPEQATSQNEKISARTDVYALGAILFELLTGEAPYSGDNLFDVLHQIVVGDPPSLKARRADLPDEICDVVAKALRKKPSRRHASVGVLSRRFSAAVLRAEDADEEPTFRWDRFHELASGGAAQDEAPRAPPEMYEVTVPAHEADLITAPPASAGFAAPHTDLHGRRGTPSNTDPVTDRDTESDPVRGAGPADAATLAGGPALVAVTPPLQATASGELDTDASSKPSAGTATDVAPVQLDDISGLIEPATPVAAPRRDAPLSLPPLDADESATVAWSALHQAREQRPRREAVTRRRVATAPPVDAAPRAHAAPLARFGNPLLAAGLLVAILIFAGAVWAVCGLR